MNVNDYIRENLKDTVRERKTDEYPFFALPCPYNVPCASGMFQEMYYWDTYFTNRGLIIDGNVAQAKNNADNLIYMAKRFGYVLNGNRVEFLNNSQPPFLSQTVREIYDVTRDKSWLAQAYEAIQIEYNFWTQKRGTDTGLCRYDAVTPIPEEQVDRGAKLLSERLGYTPDADKYALARGLFAVGESGWDINPRMTYRAYDFLPIELNSLIYSIEDNMSYFSLELGRDSEALSWIDRRDRRAELCRRYMRNEKGLFYDFDLASNQRTNLFSAASYYPLYFGMASEEEARAAKDALGTLESNWGIVACERCDQIKGNFQWGYPNGWPPMQQIVVGGLIRYGYTEDAKRIAKKFNALLDKCFNETGHLWEKYDVVNGSADAVAEYETPAMLGWTYGTYRCFERLLSK